MGVSLYIMLLTIFSLAALAIIKLYHYKKDISRMTGMMAAMTLGMGMGLLYGVVFGVAFAGNLFISTVLGMGTGIVIGLLAGFPLSSMAMLDGMLSGLMGGMMGAMLGEMLPEEYRDAMVKILFLFFVAVFSLLLQMVQMEHIKEGEKAPNYPLLAIILFGLFFVVNHQFGPVFSESPALNQGHPEPDGGDHRIIIQTEDFVFSPSTLNLRAGEKVTIMLTNKGGVDHDLEIPGLTTITSKVESSDHNHGTKNVHVYASPGEKTSVTFTPLESGTYQFICTLPGHKESGMVGTLTISSP